MSGSGRGGPGWRPTWPRRRHARCLPDQSGDGRSERRKSSKRVAAAARLKSAAPVAGRSECPMPSRSTAYTSRCCEKNSRLCRQLKLYPMSPCTKTTAGCRRGGGERRAHGDSASDTPHTETRIPAPARNRCDSCLGIAITPGVVSAPNLCNHTARQRIKVIIPASVAFSGRLQKRPLLAVLASHYIIVMFQIQKYECCLELYSRRISL